MRRRVVLVTVLAVLGTIAPGAVAAASLAGSTGGAADGAVVDATTPRQAAAPEPRLSVFAPDDTIEPGTRTRLTVQVINSISVGTMERNGSAGGSDGSMGVARGVEIDLDDGDAPIDIESEAVPLGTLPDGARASAPFTVVVDDDVTPGTYDAEAELTYRYRDGRVERTERVTRDVTLRVTEDARFEVDRANTTAQVGGDGTVSLALTNVGEAVAEDAVVTVESRGPLTFGGASTTTRYVDSWDEDETRTLALDAAVAPTATADRYPIAVTVAYDTPGERRASRTLTTGVTPLSEQSFSLSIFADRLVAGDEGAVAGVVRNTGPTASSSRPTST
ncbi:hypothetical protein BRD17_00560 [Halobacteriales archaeon SW_7_68_16]|nr:MAG: hypothetical protein BRD17_00560 [Halobacteriales archaeon SW_7_68_16]